MLKKRRDEKRNETKVDERMSSNHEKEKREESSEWETRSNFAIASCSMKTTSSEQETFHSESNAASESSSISCCAFSTAYAPSSSPSRHANGRSSACERLRWRHQGIRVLCGERRWGCRNFLHTGTIRIRWGIVGTCWRLSLYVRIWEDWIGLEDPRGSGRILFGLFNSRNRKIDNGRCWAGYFDAVGVIQWCVSIEFGEGPTGIWAML